jgi:alpha-L-fucosidase
MYEHLEQLLTGYGKIDGLFFDGLGTKYYDWDTPRMLKMIRTLQPGIIINRRWGAGMPGFPVSGDYDNPEQQFGTFEVERPWEMCCTISEAWSWTNGERFKTYRTNQRMFIQTMCSGGNIAINTGPSPLGFINPPDVDIFNKIGQWFKKYGESIYETKGGPYKPGAWGGATCKGNVIYLHLLADFALGTKKEIVLPPLPAKIKKATILTGGKVKVSNTAEALTVSLSGKINNLDNLVKLELESDAESLTPIETVREGAEITGIHGEASTSPDKLKSPASVFGEGGDSFAEGKRHKIWWSPADDDKQPWIQAEFRKKEKIEFIMLAEQIRNCSAREFKIDYLKNGKWETLYRGNEIGMDFCLKVDNVETNSLRVTILKTNEDRNPAIGVFRVFKKRLTDE